MESGLALDLRIASPETGRHTEPPRTPLARRMLWMVTLALDGIRDFPLTVPEVRSFILSFGRSLILERRKGINPDRQHPKRSLSFR